MDSKTATRMWRIYKESNRPWPVICEDDVVDFMIMEAVAVRSKIEQDEAEKEQARMKEVKDWKKDKSGLDNLREVANT